MSLLKKAKCYLYLLMILLAGSLGGCASATSGLECGLESMNPTVMAAIDSFESAAIAIKLSNRVLLEIPINEQDSWPEKLYGVPSAEGLFKMGLSLLGSSQGVTIPLEIDPQTGLPRPTSALYIFLKERERMLSSEESKEDIRFFIKQPPKVIAREIPFHRLKPNVELIDQHVYRNPLMAFGVVTANQDEMVRVQQDIDLVSKGFKQCDAWVHKSREGDVKPAACQDPALKQDALESRMKKASYTKADDPKYQQTTPEPPPEAPPKPVATKPVQPVKPAADLSSYQSRGNATAATYANNTKQKGKKIKKTKKPAAPLKPEPVAIQPPEPPKPVVQPVAAPEPEEPPAKGVVYASERDRQIAEKTEEFETMRKNYGKLAGRVYNASVAGADFTMAAIVKIGCAVVNGARALPNIKNEFSNARGYYNIAMVVSRVKMIIDAFSFYKDNLGLQFTAYTTMYQQIKGTYPDLKDDDPAKEQSTTAALNRIQLAMATLEELEPKFQKMAKGNDVTFTDAEVLKMNNLASVYPDSKKLERDMMLAWNGQLQQ